MALVSVTVLYFAWMRELVGTGSQKLLLRPGINVVDAIEAALASLPDGTASRIRGRLPDCAVAVNDEYCLDRAATLLKDGDELAFIPPVSGG
jgi:molybdopterin converting factor subunit 1